MKKILIFTHNDLDGVGVQILAEMYAKDKEIQAESFRCNYHDISTKILDSIKNPKEIEEIIIGDISVNPETAAKLDKLYKSGIPVRLRDHHETASWLNRYPWATVREKDEDSIPRCGTWMLSQDEDFSEIKERMLTFIEEVDNWDTWKWKESDDVYAKNLNSLLQIMGQKEFYQYITSLYTNSHSINKPEDLFTDYVKIMLATYSKHINKIAKNCENLMWLTDIEIPYSELRYKTGVVFCNDNISEVADIILSNHPELDILMLVSLPRNISFRTQKNLDVPLGQIAKAVTGSGGGHPQAAGSAISSAQFSKTFSKMLKTLGENVAYGAVNFSNFYRED